MKTKLWFVLTILVLNLTTQIAMAAGEDIDKYPDCETVRREGWSYCLSQEYRCEGVCSNTAVLAVTYPYCAGVISACFYRYRECRTRIDNAYSACKSQEDQN